MPIRVERDTDSGGSFPRRPTTGGGSGGSGGFANLIPLLLGLFARRPKLLIVVVIIAALWYFLGGKGCGSILAPGNTEMSSIFSTGAQLDEKKYAETEIFEPLAENRRNPLPEAVSLQKYAPNRLNQGQQGSCVAWASAYAARTILQARESGANPNEVCFSPSYLYNQIALQNCQGSYLPEAMKLMQGQGLAPMRDFPYSDESCSEQPAPFVKKKAEDFKIDGYQRLTKGDDPKSVDMLAVKQNLAQGAPVVIGMLVGGTFMQDMVGKDKWLPEPSDFDQVGFGGHAMCVIGYDDYKFAQNMGGFQLMNSWGTDWGNKGLAWVSYADFEVFVKEAYGLYPMGSTDEPTSTDLQFQLGVVLNADDSDLPMSAVSDGLFRAGRKLKKGESGGERFKIRVTNNLACYVYVFGQELNNGNIYPLFPYTEKHSPFCGITGTRLFPKDHSFFPDDAGTLDEFAVLITHDPVDYVAFAENLNASSGNSLRARLDKTAPQNDHTTLNAGKTVDGQCAGWKKGDSIAVVIQITK